MKTRFILACAAAGVAVSVFGGSPASADNSFTGSIDIMQEHGRPGDIIDIIGTCTDPAFRAAPIISDVLELTSISGHEDGAGRPESEAWSKTLKAYATIKADAKPGTWDVSFKCGSTLVTGHLKVVGPAPGPYAGIGIQDKVIHPRQDVLIVASCQDSAFARSKVSSPALTSPDLVREKGKSADSVLFADARINKDTKPGTYSISFMCVDKTITGKFTVEANPAPVQAKAAQVPVKPKGAAETGDLTTAPTDQVPVTALLIGGAIVLLASAGLGTWWAFRRRA